MHGLWMRLWSIPILQSIPRIMVSVQVQGTTIPGSELHQPNRFIFGHIEQTEFDENQLLNKIFYCIKHNLKILIGWYLDSHG